MGRRYGEREYAQLRYETWMRSHGRMTYAVVAMAMVTLMAFMATLWSLTSQPEPRYFAARENGGILPLVPVSVPFLSDGEVTHFAVEAVTRALTMDFANWRHDLGSVSDYFERPAGWHSFLDALNESGMLSYIREHRLVSTAVANGAVVVKAGLDAHKRHAWAIQIPLTITYESASEIRRDNLIADVDVSRLPTWEVPKAVGITRIVVRPGQVSEIQ